MVEEGETEVLPFTATDPTPWSMEAVDPPELVQASMVDWPAVMVPGVAFDRTGARMGHISISGPEGSIASFEPLAVARKIYVHINNSNPVLDANSPQHAAVRAAGWEIGVDGMEVTL